MSRALVAFAAFSAGGLVAALVARLRSARAPQWSFRTNVRGRAVPAVLGDALAAGAVAGLAVVAAAAAAASLPARRSLPAAGAVAVVAVVLYAAGHLDDRRGDERARGFGGHLRALRAGRLTGGMIKIVAGGLAGLAAALLVSTSWRVLALGALVALSANLFNLLDRAPGRALKLGLLGAGPIAVWGAGEWGLAAAGVLGSAVVLLPPDLRERGMLGDAGANPWGGVIGLGLGMSLPDAGLVAALVLVALANAASERWSFSHAIDRTPPLRAFDSWGRSRH